MNKLQAILIAGLLSLSSVSFASTFNFAAYADGNLAGSTAVTGLGEAGYETFSATNDSITVTATGSNSSGVKAYAYLDSDKAGLGVCSTGLNDTSLGKNQCVVRSDDNVTANESVTLDFGGDVKIDYLELVDANHSDAFGGYFDLIIDGILFSPSILLETNPVAVLGLIGRTFEFVNIGGRPGDEFYINNISVSTVPVPAAGILFASALFGAGALGRRKKKAKASVVGAFARAS